MALPNINGQFRVIGQPELKFTKGGKAVVKIRGVASRSKKNEQTGEWENQGEVWANIEAWERDAEAIAETVVDRDNVLVQGQLEVREYERNDGAKGTSVDIKFAKVAVLPKSGATRQQAAPAAPANDPWAAPATNADPPF